MSHKPGWNSVLFQARRFEQHLNSSSVVYCCPMCLNGSSLYDTTAVLQHARSYHVAIARFYPDGSPWKIYLYECIQRARNPAGNASLPYSMPYMDYDGIMKFSGFPGPHMQDQQSMFSHSTAGGVVSNLTNLHNLSLENPPMTQAPGTTIPSKRPAAYELDSSPPHLGAAGRADQAGRKRTARQSKAAAAIGGQKTRPVGADTLSGRTTEPEVPAEGSRKHRKLSKREHRQSQLPGNNNDNNFPADGRRCTECSRRDTHCEKDADTDTCKACAAERLECKSMDRQSNCAQASHRAHAEEETLSASSSYYDESLHDSSTDTLDDEPGPIPYDDTRIEVLLQPQTKPITLAQLEIEVGTIQKAVEAFELHCRDEYTSKLADARLATEERAVMQKKDYTEYIGRHKSFMQETHDLCLATQHPVASPQLRALPRKINVPARMWQYGIAAPLEVLRMRLPDSREHAVAFILIAFNMMTLFLETVPDFEATWLECIGDLARYRLGLAETDEEKDIFSTIATYWFRRALELNPQIGRLRHHLAVLVPNFSVEQLSLYGHALTAYTPFFAARKSVLASLKPVLDESDQLQGRVPSMSLAFLRAHASLFIGGRGSLAIFNASVQQLNNSLFAEFVTSAAKEKSPLKKFGCYVAIANSAAIFEYGATTETNRDRSIIRYAFLTRHVARAHAEQQQHQQSVKEALANPRRDLASLSGNDVLSRLTISRACTMAFGMLKVALRRPKDENLHPMIHISFAMIWAFCDVPMAIRETESKIPWQEIVNFLNAWANALTMTPHICSHDFPHKSPDKNQALPEDFMTQGLWFTQDYFPPRWCERSKLDQQERLIEKEEYVAPRIERILWLGYGIAAHNEWISYDRDTKSFQLTASQANSTSNATDTYPTEPELQPLYQLDTQPTQSNWNTQPSIRPAQRSSWKEGEVGNLSPPGQGGNSRIRVLAREWALFKPKCESFITNPPVRHDEAVRAQRSLGESIAQDFLAEINSILREAEENNSGSRAAKIGTASSTKETSAAYRRLLQDSEILKGEMQTTSRKINNMSKSKRQDSRKFDIYADDMTR